MKLSEYKVFLNGVRIMKVRSKDCLNDVIWSLGARFGGREWNRLVNSNRVNIRSNFMTINTNSVNI